MNTDLRKCIFVALQGAEDDVHACQRLCEITMGSPKQRTNDIANVVVHCCLRDKGFQNPFYARVLSGLAELPGNAGKEFTY